MVICLASITYALMEGGSLGWGSWPIVFSLLVAFVSVVGFILWEKKTPAPLLDLKFFTSVPFSIANVIAILAFAALASFLYLNSIYLQQERHFSAFHTGILMLPLAIISLFFGPYNGRILSKYGARLPLIIAGIGFLITGIMLSVTGPFTGLLWLCIAYAIMGIANSAVGAPITYMAISGMPPSQGSLAAGVSSTSRQIGQTLGIAVIGIFMSDVGGNNASDLSAAITTGWQIMSGYGALILIMGLVATSGWAKKTAKR